MFFSGERINSFRKMILVADTVKRLRQKLAASSPAEAASVEAELSEPQRIYWEALAELLPHQRDDFYRILMVLNGLPCTIRLLDPPLHEFLPKDDQGQEEMASAMGVSSESIAETVERLSEFNPMLGHRGCRLGLTYPEVSDMQVRAIMEAAVRCKDEGVKVQPEIMIPLVGHHRELSIARERAQKVIDDVLREAGKKPDFIEYRIGTMIEVPRAALTADEVASHADFFSFGTNDLTQMGCGLSRDDSGRFLGDYVRMGIYEKDPFAVLDTRGVGRLVALACEDGRRARPDLKVGICGEHGGEPSSIDFCHRVGLDYVSCSPYRVPVARLAAAQAAIANG
jgi:pyruvate,orthophosphate dikinase